MHYPRTTLRAAALTLAATLASGPAAANPLPPNPPPKPPKPAPVKPAAPAWRWSAQPNHYPLVALRAHARRHLRYVLRELPGRSRRVAELSRELVKGGVRKAVWRRRLADRVGNPGAAMVVHGYRIFIARYHRNATGCRLYAFAAITGKPLWRVALRGVESIGHSKYANRVQLTVIGGDPVVFGYESGGAYVERRDAKTGALRAHRRVKIARPATPLAERLYRELHDVMKRRRRYRRSVAAFVAGHGLRFASPAARLAAVRRAIGQLDGLPVSRGRRKLKVWLQAVGGKQLIVAKAR